MKISLETLLKVRDALQAADEMCGGKGRLPSPAELGVISGKAMMARIILENEMKHSDEQVEPRDASDNECPHGLQWVDCAACMEDSDHAYDSAREDRYFHR